MAGPARQIGYNDEGGLAEEWIQADDRSVLRGMAGRAGAVPSMAVRPVACVRSVPLEPGSLLRELGCDFECPPDEWEFVLVPDGVVVERRRGACKLDERDVAR